jgi:hypothetical protein
MTLTRHIVKIVAVNVAIAFMLIGIFVAAPIAIIKTYDIFRVIVPVSSSNSMQQLPNYTDISWADQYFSDHKNIGSSYSDFVIWELDPLSSETINIDDDGRRHTVVSDVSSAGSVWVFGGSTVFGTGVNDANTIPSLLAEKTGFNAINFGGDNYIARQGVNRLLREYEDYDVENLIVVFYDGVNDVHVKCRVENLDLVTDRQDQIRGALGDNRAAQDASLSELLGPASVLIDKVYQRGVLGGPGKETDDLFVCDDDVDRADQVARALVSDWKAAQAITEANGGRFVAVLQPVSFLSDTRLEHLTQGEYYAEFAKQYSAVYPLIRSYASAAEINFVDLSHILDHDEFIYIDFCHVSANGNKYVANALANILL